VLGHRVHGTGDEGCLQLDVPREAGRNVHVVETKANVSRHHDEIIVRVRHTARILDKDLRSRETEREDYSEETKESARNLTHPLQRIASQSQFHAPIGIASAAEQSTVFIIASYPSAPEFRVSSSISSNGVPFSVVMFRSKVESK
jgi:hypothetical protein